MSKRLYVILPGVALLGIALVALPGQTAKQKQASGPAAPERCVPPCGTAAAAPVELPEVAPDEEAQIGQETERELAQAQEQLARAQARLQAERARLLAGAHVQKTHLRAQQAALAALAHAQAARLGDEQAGQALEDVEDDLEIIAPSGGDRGWLGVKIDEVTPEKAKELKLSAVRGVLLSDVEKDSPAAKGGLKAGDVITEYNGQRVEGTVQFRRMIRETPAGRTAQLIVWREGRAQNFSVELGGLRSQMKGRVRAFAVRPKDFDFHFEMPDIDRDFLMPRRPTLGIDAEDLSGQLGSYFGAPDGEGVLVREVKPGTPAEKAGLKAGDVITKLDGERVRTVSDLRAKMREKREKKSVTVGVVRKGAEMSLNVEVEQPKPPADRKRLISRRISI